MCLQCYEPAAAVHCRNIRQKTQPAGRVAQHAALMPYDAAVLQLATACMPHSVLSYAACLQAWRIGKRLAGRSAATLSAGLAAAR
jgi:hypothetical protein